MATDPKRFMALGLAPALARETLTGDVTGTGSGTTNIEIETTTGGG